MQKKFLGGSMKGADIETPKASTGWDCGGMSPPQPTMGLGERRELPSQDRGGAPAANAFSSVFE